MPIFRYHCQECNLDFELLLAKFDSPAFCPACGNENPEKQPSLIGGISCSAGDCGNRDMCPSGHQCSGKCCH